jgi:hypothetical protein
VSPLRQLTLLTETSRFSERQAPVRRVLPFESTRISGVNLCLGEQPLFRVMSRFETAHFSCDSSIPPLNKSEGFTTGRSHIKCRNVVTWRNREINRFCDRGLRYGPNLDAAPCFAGRQRGFQAMAAGALVSEFCLNRRLDGGRSERVYGTARCLSRMVSILMFAAQ